MPDINQELFQKIYDQISQHPETHGQSTWEAARGCGTTRCVAGWAINFVHNMGVYQWSDTSDVDIAVEGRRLLGLNPQQLNLFYCTDAQALEIVHGFAVKGDEFDMDEVLDRKSRAQLAAEFDRM